MYLMSKSQLPPAARAVLFPDWSDKADKDKDKDKTENQGKKEVTKKKGKKKDKKEVTENKDKETVLGTPPPELLKNPMFVHRPSVPLCRSAKRGKKFPLPVDRDVSLINKELNLCRLNFLFFKMVDPKDGKPMDIYASRHAAKKAQAQLMFYQILKV